MNEDTLRASAQRSRAMRQWAEGPGGLYEVFAAVKAIYFDEISRSDPKDTAFREGAYHRIKALEDIRKSMVAVITEGAGSEKILEELSRKAERTKKVVKHA